MLRKCYIHTHVYTYTQKSIYKLGAVSVQTAVAIGLQDFFRGSMDHGAIRWSLIKRQLAKYEEELKVRT